MAYTSQIELPLKFSELLYISVILIYIQPLVYRRMFGDFDCKCGNSWKSAYTWVSNSGYRPLTKWQKCLRCSAEVYPTDYRPLIYTGSVSQGGHESSKCQRCIELGGDCRTYVASNTEDEIPDDISLISEASSISSVGGDDNTTPVASDSEEYADELLSKQLKDLAL